jgi:SAM-dependent methyltransferase
VLLHKILGLGEEESVFLAEESLEDLITLPVSIDLLSSGIDCDRAVEIRSDRRLGMAFHFLEPAEFWLLLTDLYSGEKVLEGLDDAGCLKAYTSDEEFFQALTEYFATSLASELLCESCPTRGHPQYVEERIDRLEAFLSPLLPGGRILEVCCGSGMATQALLRLGHRPWSVDSDRCELCLALKAGTMHPERSFVLDARLLGRFFEEGAFDAVVGFMVGLIDNFNWGVWRDILLTSSSLARHTVLYTVYTEREAEMIARALREAGWEEKVIDNRDLRGIYDQWACLARRSLPELGTERLIQSREGIKLG